MTGYGEANRLLDSLVEFLKHNSYWFTRDDQDAIEARITQIRERFKDIYERNNHQWC